MTGVCLYESFLQSGLDALENSHRPKIQNVPRDTKSFDIDKHFKEDCPNANRWDYAIFIPSQKRIVFVEHHSAHTTEVSVMGKKIEWLRTKIESDVCLKSYKLEFHWIQSKDFKIQKSSPQYRQLQKLKCGKPKSTLDLSQGKE
jgi:hypothetical protein